MGIKTFSLQHSEVFQLQNNQGVQVDLGLTALPANAITGKVFYCGCPISRATVVVLDAKLNPVTYSRTNHEGIYLIGGLDSRSYGLTATAKGFTASKIIYIFLLENEKKIMDIDLIKPSYRFIYGLRGGQQSNLKPGNCDGLLG